MGKDGVGVRKETSGVEGGNGHHLKAMYIT